MKKSDQLTCHLLNSRFQKKSFTDFKEISDVIGDKRIKIHQLELEAIIKLLSRFGKELIFDKKINTLEGVNYLSLWLRQDNLKKICDLNYIKNDYMVAQPRGIVCHWIAANIPTLAFFSLTMAVLSRNASIVKVPKTNLQLILLLLKKLSRVSIIHKGKSISGRKITDSISIITFPSQNLNINQKFSLSADCKIIWGGTEAVSAITALPQKEHCEVITFGPKYSFGLYDTEFIESRQLDRALEKSVLDIVLFNQAACSSPHVYFFEKSKYSLYDIAYKMKTSFEKLPRKYSQQKLPETTISKIINTRGVYLLEQDKNILKSNGLEWTILINKELNLEEPIQGKTIFIKEVKNINQVVPLITRKIQAISASILNPKKRRLFAEKATFKGADRIVAPGEMHNFDVPWDGVLILNRLIRWVLIKN